MLEINNLNKKYSTQTVLNNITIKCDKQVIGFVGNNGSGKTTLFKCIAGIEKYNGIIVQPVAKENKIGLLLTEPYFMPYITGYEYLLLLCKARNIKTSDFEKANLFKLPLNQYAHNYSTGMKKKLALTGVLLQQNEYYILDEPYNGVDMQGCQMIMAIIEKIKTMGHSIIISSHILETLTQVCDTIFVIDNGYITDQIQQQHFEQFAKTRKNEAFKNIDAMWD